LVQNLVQNKSMIYGYARVSADDQSVAAQVATLRKHGAGKVFREVASRTKTERAQLRRLLNQLDGDDMVMVTRLDCWRDPSRETFLKAILTIKAERRPGLGLSPTGNLIAAWTTARDRLTIEFLPNDRVRWVLARYRDTDEPARFAGQTDVSELVDGLAPHPPEHWFSHASKNHELRWTPIVRQPEPLLKV
jgi:hypothetical protein